VYVGRYAPSPTGDLHLGNARTALLAWLWARRAGGRFLLRFEDLDTPRVRPGCAQEQAESLAWLGLDWDGTPVAQSDRTGLYERALEALGRRGVLYECFCSRTDVRRAASAPHGPDGPTYSGLCRDLSESERAERRLLGREPSLRVRMEGTSGDIVVRRGDGVVAYQLAVVVDDAQQGVSHVVRGEDLADNTARQIHLQRLLGLPTPVYLHTPLVLGPDGEKLSKQNGAQPLDLGDPLAVLVAAGEVLGIHARGDDVPGWLAQAMPAWRSRWATAVA
jgi:glutamyl-queuosine tRNA(Asp) synthetase